MKPTTYKPEYIEEVDEYLNTAGREQTTLPTRVGFAKFIGVHRSTVNEWEHLHPKFKKALEEIDAEQKEQLMNDGMYGGKEINSTMAIFLLKVNHNMIEKSAMDVTSEGKKLEAPHIVIRTKNE